MSDSKPLPEKISPAGETPAAAPPLSERCRELAELEQEIRRQLRSNQRFLEGFLDEDFVDDEETGEEESDHDDEEL